MRSTAYCVAVTPQGLKSMGMRTPVRSALFEQPDWVNITYEKGVPMGGELELREKPFQIAVQAMKDPDGANLDRIQIIKLWSDGYQEHEKIYDVAVSDTSRSDPKTGVVSPVPNTVDVSKATYSNEHGAKQLQTLWTDPDFQPGQEAAYYARVLEVPTPRWSTYDAVALGLPPSDKVPATIQERAWTSPVWISKKN